MNLIRGAPQPLPEEALVSAEEWARLQPDATVASTIARLTAEVRRLRAENAALRERLADSLQRERLPDG